MKLTQNYSKFKHSIQKIHNKKDLFNWTVKQFKIYPVALNWSSFLIDDKVVIVFTLAFIDNTSVRLKNKHIN